VDRALQPLPDYSSTSPGGVRRELPYTGTVRVSLIVTTYNWPRALDLVMKGIARQRRPPDEVIVADDGSAEETARVVAAWTRRLSVPLHHVWQENRGFRAGRSRNRAIAAARGEYIILLDGDMVPDEHFVEDHLHAATLGCFVQGVRIPANEKRTAHMLANGVTSVGLFTPGIRRSYHAVRSRWLSKHLSRPWVRMSSIKSCNQGFWRADLVAVNGFNEQIKGWGPEDKECCARVVHSGVAARHVRFMAQAVHLHHASRAPAGPNPNDAILEATLARRSTRCDIGLDQHLAEFATGIPASARPPWRL
jgi:glycosyltransferase involved in cell wall biosynthesis